MTDQDRTVHEFYMAQCIKLALVAKARGDSPVGSVIVKDGQVIAEGTESGKTNNDITFHAEIEATRQATKNLNSSDLSDCVMYTTHEPCIMCSYVIRHHKINTIIVGLTTGEIGGYSSALPLLLDKTITKWGNPPKIIDGILANECKKLQGN
jgi:tRNA(adenine34) deaminase